MTLLVNEVLLVLGIIVLEFEGIPNLFVVVILLVNVQAINAKKIMQR